jgi:hypothetical protein
VTGGRSSAAIVRKGKVQDTLMTSSGKEQKLRGE